MSPTAERTMEQEKIRILYVDDEPNNLAMFKAGFRLEYDILTALSGKEALEILRQHSVHIIIADQRMPEMSGVELFERLLEEHPEPIRILLTGYANIESVIDAINRGQVFRYVRKPWDEDDLRMTIDNACEMYQTRQTLKTKNAELEKTNADLVRVNEELNRFVYSASHDLKAPLASIMGIVEVARMEGEEHETAYYLSLIERSVKQLETFIQNIIDYYKNTRYQENLTEIDFNGLVNEIIESFHFHPNTAQIEFDVKVHQPTSFVSDEFRMRVILNNLISNAIKYQQKPEAHKHVDIEVRMAAENAEIRIRDNGIGIAAEYVDDIFKMFFRATETSAGSGMGLYIVKEAVEKLHGRIRVDSKEGQGTSFTVVLPNRS